VVTTGIGTAVWIKKLVFRLIRTLFRMIFPFRHKWPIHVAMPALLNLSLRASTDIAIFKLLSALVSALNRVRRLWLHVSSLIQ
jgi:hypothetical protein